jgi:hypothetical protein
MILQCNTWGDSKVLRVGLHFSENRSNPKIETAVRRISFHATKQKKDSWNSFAGCREIVFFLHLTKAIGQK